MFEPGGTELFGRKVKQEKLSEDESDNFTSPRTLLCFVNLHNGIDLNEISACKRCPHSAAENVNLVSIKKEDGKYCSKEVKEEKCDSLNVEQIKSEFKVIMAPVSRRYVFDVIELSSDSEEENAISISSTKTSLVNNSLFLKKENHEEREHIVKAEIKEEKYDENFNQEILVNNMYFKKDKWETIDEFKVENYTKEEPVEEDFIDQNLINNNLEDAFEKSSEIASDFFFDKKQIEDNFSQDTPKNDFLLFDKESLQKADEKLSKNKELKEKKFDESIRTNEKSEKMKKIQLLKYFCESSFECKYCHKRFVQKALYASHVKVSHEGHKPYKCKICGKAFKYTVARRQHYFKDHDNIVSYKCKICGKQFMTKGWYEKHKCSMRKFKK